MQTTLASGNRAQFFSHHFSAEDPKGSALVARDIQKIYRIDMLGGPHTGSSLFEHKVVTKVKQLYFNHTHRFLTTSVGEQSVIPSGLPFGCDLVLWRISDGKEIAIVSKTDQVIAFEFSADGSSFAAVNRGGSN